MLPMFTALGGKTASRSAPRVYAGNLPLNSPSSKGIAAGDLAVIVGPDTTPPASGATGTATWAQFTNGGGWGNVFWRKLDAADVANPITAADAAIIAVWHGPNSLAVLSDSGRRQGSAHTYSFSGAALSANSMGIMAVTRSLGAGFEIVNAYQPTGFASLATSQFYYNYTSTNDNKVGLALYERASPPNTRYAGQSFTFTWGGSGDYSMTVFELRG